MKKNLKILILLLIPALILSGCGREQIKEEVNTEENEREVLLEKIKEEEGKIMENYEESAKKTNYVKLEMENGGIMIIELYPDIAPITVKNFKKLVNEKYYDGLIFHRVIKDFMIQTGDPTGTGTGGSEETIKGEFSSNGVENNLSHTRGVVSMARKSNDFDSASSQFFICQVDTDTFLDGDYAAFGKVVEGLDLIDYIASVDTDVYDKPLVEQKIKTISFVSKKD